MSVVDRSSIILIALPLRRPAPTLLGRVQAPEPMERSKPSLTSDRPTYAAQNPYLQPQAPRGSSPATTSVTPDLGEGNTARSQRRAFSTETTKSSRATNGPCEPLDEPEGRVDREGSGLRRSPSLVTVQDVYPPELSRYNSVLWVCYHMGVCV